MKKITNRQLEILTFIKDFKSETGYPPTRRDITDEFGFRSPNAAEEHLRALEDKAYITIKRNTSRGILVNQEFSDENLAIIGRVAAGAPVLAVENVEKELPVSPSLFSPRADYLLRVQGESMIDAGIFDGDLLAVHQTKDIRDGQIVVARVADEVTVKRFRKGKKFNEVILEAENEEFNDIHIDTDVSDFTVEGISVGVLRLG